MSNCIQERNPGAGFLNSHKRFCLYCDADATKHVNMDDRFCGNVCVDHAKRAAARGTGVDIQDGVFIAE